ncbi:hypothetical protein PAXRUDRAFT_825102 [Paxillus rubicundulus Ve08.2h10]|uniref:Uncharacterized protein n=1 Tax=Paxillus rubicundulus Ve08.2h10 TaxID=930991 RepID=A0A0D0DTL6_9AGAM|nr:hypothetical protein PAXRUDRAFT_825102 [Paxillus rubicundulus Ve08.2h10]
MDPAACASRVCGTISDDLPIEADHHESSFWSYFSSTSHSIRTSRSRSPGSQALCARCKMRPTPFVIINVTLGTDSHITDDRGRFSLKRAATAHSLLEDL